MRIKKHKNKNEYLQTADGLWVRNFTNLQTPGEDLNNLLRESDYKIVLDNETNNKKMGLDHIDSHQFDHPNCVIVSDGYSFKEKQHLLAELPKGVIILGVNGSLKKWDLDLKVPMKYYVANHPYKEALVDLPVKHAYFPKCIASTRTCSEFLTKYGGYKYQYTPVTQTTYKGPTNDWLYQIDDYRNPICAAIGVAFRFNVKKLLLFCCDDSFESERPAAERLENGLC
jgi:hypothetical protein